jgi:hypothetical protein
MKLRIALVSLLIVCGHLPAVSAAGQSAFDPQGAIDGVELSGDSQADGDTPVRLLTTCYKATDAGAWVMLAIDIGADALRLREMDGAYRGRLEVRYVATDAAGTARSGVAYDGTLALDPGARARASRHGLRVLTWLDLPAGPYELRVTARADQGLGSAVQHLDVPDFSAPLTMSNTSVSTDAEDVVTIAPDEGARIALPGSPTVGREFQTGETLALFTEVYESAQRLRHGPTLGRPSDPDHRELGDHTTNVIAQLHGDDGSILLVSLGVPAMDSARPAGRHAFLTSVSLDGVPPGRYVLRVRARANIGRPDMATEDIPIRVR